MFWKNIINYNYIGSCPRSETLTHKVSWKEYDEDSIPSDIKERMHD
jgi:hypothetical protein